MKIVSQDIFEPEMPVVPSDWVVLPFEQAADVISDKGKRVKQGSYLPVGKIPVIDQGQDTIGGYTNDENMAFDDGLPVILFGDHTRSLKYVDKRFAVGAEGVKILRPREVYVPKFFYYLLRSLQIPSRGYSRHFQFLRKFHFPLAPEDQQKGIVAEIEKQFSRLDEAVANLKRVKVNLKRYKASVLKAAVEGKLTKDWRKQHSNVEPANKLLERILTERRAKWSGKGNYKDPAKPGTANLPALPNSWIWASFEQISLRVTVGHVGPMKHEYVPKGIPFLRSQNVRENKFDSAGLLFIRPEFHSKLSKSVIRSGDLAVVRSGSVGVTCVIPGTLGEANCADLVLIQGPIGLVPQFGAYYMNSMAKRHIEAGKVGIALTHFNTRSVAAMPVPLPPLAEQERIVSEVERRLSVIEELEAAVETNLTRADRLRQAILTNAFVGQLTNEAGREDLC